ncbi:Single-stranded-DNA-specific exonuclease RecJ [Lacunisphaera limnophila]|uniref:Single-stranded-DNA-specific exonuclease RecJ n=1 Tax=Lacunisphaera limnophila TaxID=1838286 RepID=A0A1D8AXJ7_9BACT|nr:single-stranded-DNA-specific exonuclease RecJ [Lacunisphaera limnophila]AOS45597.1 Single-stranded-DNA-specific exonuclease RecJ [Lacunisphaera limnophila]
MRWNYTPVHAESVGALARSLGTTPVVAELLLRAGVPEAGAVRFLQPTLASLGDPFLVVNLERAVDRLLLALQRHERVTVLGDYDVDGVCSTSILVCLLRRLGLTPAYLVPRRAEEGYGLSATAIERALEQGCPDLFIALDCGTNSGAEVALLRSRGAEVIIVDHHRSTEPPATDAILINPHVHPAPDDGAWHYLCTVGLVFKLAHGLLKKLRAENHPVALSIVLKDYLDLVAMGTIADLVPLHGENRIFARHGLRVLAETRRPGLIALMQVSGLKTDQGLVPTDVSFRLGPRINASGRLADAALSVDLLLSADPAFCDATARQLDALNRERQDIERQITERAERYVEEHFQAASGLVLFDEAWHPGVVGIVAGRISRKYHRPAIVLGNEGELAKGSGRGINGFNLVEILAACADCLDGWGGHPMAVGVALKKGRLDEFRARFDEVIRTRSDQGAGEPGLELSGWLDATEVTDRLMGELEQLHPFGMGNPEPVFGVRGLRLRNRPDVFKEQHFRFSGEDATGRRISGVAWKLADRLPPVGQPIEIAVQLNWNHYNGRRTLQMELLDWRVAGT